MNLKSRKEIPANIIARLVELATISLEMLDVPVAAVLLYNGEIIGEGFNSVARNNSAGEHAEINAITGAIRGLGMEKFSRLDRSSLVLVSTFEPCLKCVGACVQYNVRTVFYLQEKEQRDLLWERYMVTRYFFRRRQVKNNGEQISLFKLHPEYSSQAVSSKK